MTTVVNMLANGDVNGEGQIKNIGSWASLELGGTSDGDISTPTTPSAPTLPTTDPVSTPGGQGGV